MQCRVDGVEINKCPKFLKTLPQENSHCIIIKDEYGAKTLRHLALQRRNLFKKKLR